MAKPWERLRSSPRLKGAVLYAIVALFALATGFLPDPHEGDYDVDRSGV
jgi:hypothetical protein